MSEGRERSRDAQAQAAAPDRQALACARLNSGRDRATLERELLGVIRELFDLEAVRLFKAHPDPAEAAGAESGLPAPTSVSERAWLRGHCRAAGEPDLFEDPESVPGVLADEPGGDRVPIGDPRDRLGWLGLSRATALEPRERRLLEAMLRVYANHLSLLDYSEHDTLTGLKNRKTFDDRFLALTLEVPAFAPTPDATLESVDRRRRAAAAGPRWLAVVDIDHFKRINDTLGHLYGDEVLVLVAGLLRGSFRQADELYRFGGEEFAIVLQPTAAVHVDTVLDRCRQRIAAHRFPQIDRVTVSIGHTRIEPGDTPSTAFARADAALYHAKHTGRDRVCGWDSLSSCGLVDVPKPGKDIELF